MVQSKDRGGMREDFIPCRTCGQTYPAYSAHSCTVGRVVLPERKTSVDITELQKRIEELKYKLVQQDKYEVYWNQLRRMMERFREASIRGNTVLKMMDDLEGREAPKIGSTDTPKDAAAPRTVYPDADGPARSVPCTGE